MVSSLAGGCVRVSPPVMSPAAAGSCRSPALRWFAPGDTRDRTRLDAWCAGVGPPVVQPAPLAPVAESPAITLQDIAFVSWNVHVGNGDIKAFVSDLRSGRFTGGTPVRHFVLMLQEAVRVRDVPPYATGAAGARRIRARATRTVDVIEISRDLGLSVIYVPSMRNGNSTHDPAADRGSAIVSTLPMVDPIAVELPGERQRRVAILARLSLHSTDGTALSVGVLHLDALGAPKRLWFFGTSSIRELQVTSMASLLPEDDLALGADLNTWHGKAEPAPRRLAKIFGTPVVAAGRRRGLSVLDYLFFRIAGTWTAQYEVAPLDYGSDHHPLVGRLVRSQARAASKSGQAAATSFQNVGE